VTPYFQYKSILTDMSLVVSRQGSVILSGDDEGLPEFTIKEHEYKREYMTVFGPWFHISGLTFSGSGVGEYKTGVARMFAVRKDAAYSAMLTRNQHQLSRRLRQKLFCFKKHLHRHYHDEDYETSFPEWLFAPHAKKKLRLSTFERSCAARGDHVEYDRSVKYKLKPFELLKQGKKRAIGDLGAMRTNATAWSVTQFKAAWENRHIDGNYTIEFVARPDKGSLKQVFANLMGVSKGKVFYNYFSDDCNVAAGCADGNFYCNGDIEKCDASHFTPMFKILENLLTTDCSHKPTRTAKAIKRAISYLFKPLVVVNKYNHKQRCKYEFNSARLYSGSILTTLVNNCANLCIALALSLRCPDPGQVTRAEFAEMYRKSAEDCGYIMKVNVCDKPEDLQFLKHSPVRTETGDYTPIVNIGTYLRGFGKTYGDLNGSSKIPLSIRARRHISGVVRGRLNWGDHELGHSFDKFLLDEFDERVVSCERARSDGDCQRVELDAIAVRYRCTPRELEILCDYIRESDLTSIIWLPIIDKIYAVDYG